MTVAMLMKNTVISAERTLNKMLSTTWDLSPLPLVPKTPVPRSVEQLYLMFFCENTIIF